MTIDSIQKANFVPRLVIPVGLILGVVFLTSIAYEVSWRFKENQLLYPVFSVLTVIMFFSIFFPAFFIYPYTFFKGASPFERILASFIPLLVWMGKEVVRIGSVFSFGESLYFGLNPVFILLILFTLVQMGFCDPICRWRGRKHSTEKVRIFSRFSVILLLGSLLTLFLDLTYSLKIGFFYFDLYKSLFA